MPDYYGQQWIDAAEYAREGAVNLDLILALFDTESPSVQGIRDCADLANWIGAYQRDNPPPHAADTAVPATLVQTGVLMPSHVVIRDTTADSWPTESSTGTTGVLDPSASISSSGTNQIIENKDVTGSVTIAHSGVTLRNCRITATGESYGVSVNIASGTVVIEDCEIIGGTNGIVGSRVTIQRCNVHGYSQDGIKLGAASTVSDNMVHSPASFQWGDGIEVTNASNVIIDHNWIDVALPESTAPVNGAIYIGTYGGAVTATTVTHNYLNGGVANVWIDGADGAVPTGLTIADNRFGHRATSSYFRVVEGATPTWTGNTNFATGETISLASTGSGPTEPTPEPPPPTTTSEWWKTGLNPPVGPRPTVQLQQHNGDYNISTPGMTLSGFKVTGVIRVNAANVTITDCEAQGIDLQGAAGSITNIAYCRLIGGHSGEAGVVYYGYNLRNTEVRGTFDGLKALGDVLLENCWVHDMVRIGGASPTGTGGSGNTGGGASHNDGVQVSSGANLTIRNCRFENTGYNAALFLDPDFGNISNVLVENNYFQGSNFSVQISYSAQVAGNTVTSTTIRNNILGAPNTWAPDWGGYSFYDRSGASNPNAWAVTWTGNVKEVRVNGGAATYQTVEATDMNTPANQRWRN